MPCYILCSFFPRDKRAIALPPPERNGDVDMGEIDGAEGGPPGKRARTTMPVREPTAGPSNREPDMEPAANDPDPEPRPKKSLTGVKNRDTYKGQPAPAAPVPTCRQRAQTPARDNVTQATPKARPASTHAWDRMGGTYRVRAPVYVPPTERYAMMDPDFTPRYYPRRNTVSGGYMGRVRAPVYYPPPPDFPTYDSVPSRDNRDRVTCQFANIVAVIMLILLAFIICFVLWNVYEGHDMLGSLLGTGGGDVCLPALPQ